MPIPEYELIRSSRQTVAIQVRDGRLVVRAPQRMPRAVIEQVLQKHKRWIDARLGDAKRAGKPPEISPETEIRCRERAKVLLPALIEKYAPKVGERPVSMRITGAQTRFGSCSSKRTVSFSWRLMLYPIEAIEYVVVHELTHLKHMDHSAAFYADVARVMPDYKAREALLKKPWWTFDE